MNKTNILVRVMFFIVVHLGCGCGASPFYSSAWTEAPASLLWIYARGVNTQPGDLACAFVCKSSLLAGVQSELFQAG